LFQLLALREQDPELLQKAAQILFMPDLFAALLGAEPVCERSIASTSQMLDPRTGQWSREVLAAYGLPENRFAPIVSSGTVKQTGKIVVKFQRRGKPTNSALLEGHYQSEHLQDIGMSRPICCYTSK